MQYWWRKDKITKIVESSQWNEGIQGLIDLLRRKKKTIGFPFFSAGTQDSHMAIYLVN